MNLLNGSESFYPAKKKTGITAFQLVHKQILDYKYLFIGSLIFCFLLAFLVNKFTKPIYLVTTSVLIKEKTGSANNTKNLLYGDEQNSNSNEQDIQEEVTILRSFPFIRRSVEAVDLRVGYFGDARLGLTEIYNNAPFKIIFPNSDAFQKISRKKFKINFVNKTHFQLYDLDKNGGSAFDEVEINKPFNLYGCPVIVALTENFSIANHLNREYQFHTYDLDDVAWDFRNRINIRSGTAEGSIINIYLETSVPQKGIDFLNEFTKQYITYKYEEKSRAISQSMAFIDDQLSSISKSLGNTESNLSGFKTSNSFSDASKMNDRSINEMSQLQKERAALIINERYFNSISSHLQDNKDLDRLVTPSAVGINDNATDDLMRELVSLQLEKNNFTSDGESKNPLLKDLDTKISTIKNTVKKNISSLAESNRARLKQINNKNNEHRSIVANLPKAERKFVDIKRENDLNEQIYLFLSQKKLEAGILKASTTVANRVIESAVLDSSIPLKPKRSNNYALALLAGIAIPFGFIWLKGLFNKKVLGKDDFNAITNLPVIGSISHNYNATPIVVSPSSRTQIAESFRILRSYLISYKGSKHKKAILITSMDSGEGKSFCAINIATSLALLKKKTLLINFDLRTTSELYANFEQGLGISAYLDDLISIDEMITNSHHPFLDFISSGDWPGNSTELLSDEKLEPLMVILKLKYDYVIIDSAPIGIIADTLLIAQYTDLNIAVVRNNYSKKEKLSELDKICSEGKLNHVSVIFNDDRLKKGVYSNRYYFEKKEREKEKKFNLSNYFRLPI